MRPCAAPAVLAAIVAASILWPDGPPGRAQTSAAGSTAATLSLIDAAAGRVEIVRHWPGDAADVDVYPFVPYFWDGCPAPGAIMVLVTGGPAGSASTPGPASSRSAASRLHARLARAIGAAADKDAQERAELARLIARLRTPGDPVIEAAKSVLPAISDLATYERRGYAVFAFIVWQGWRCGVTFRAVPEGYGIPYVR